MLRKQYSVQLYTRDFRETNSWRAKNYVIYYGNTPQQKYIEEFPEIFKTKDDKQEFIFSLIQTLKQKREAQNARRREIRQDKKSGEYKKRKKGPKEKPIEELEELITRDYEIETIEKTARGVFVTDQNDFRHTTLTYDKPMNVNARDKFKMSQLKSMLREDFRKVLREATKHRGNSEWIIKLITPYYDADGNLMYSDEIIDEDGRVNRAATSYSHGYSLPRMGTKRIDRLIGWFEETLSNWENDIIKKYDKITSRIDVSGIMIEQTIGKR